MLPEFRRMQSDDFTGLDLPLNGDLGKVCYDGESLLGGGQADCQMNNVRGLPALGPLQGTAGQGGFCSGVKKS